jgi:alpha,alpha-trehalase
VDLNSQLYRYELDLAEFFEILGQPQKAANWRQRAEARRALIDRYLWDAESGLYRDYDLRSSQFLKAVPRSLATFVPLWAGIASQQQAQQVRNHLSEFEYDYGLAACEAGWEDDTEHNFPTGWAYSHWYVIYGLRRYGFHSDAARIAHKWLRLVALRFAQSGKLWERYNVVAPAESVPGRYRPLSGFGWTNGVFAALLVRIIMGLEYDPFTRQRLWQPQLPQAWQGQTVVLELSHYPWPQETGEKLAAD